MNNNEDQLANDESTIIHNQSVLDKLQPPTSSLGQDKSSYKDFFKAEGGTSQDTESKQPYLNKDADEEYDMTKQHILPQGD